MGETVAFFRPDDERADEAAAILRDLGVEPLSDPMLAVDPTGDAPRTDADVTVLTSRTGVELAGGAGWTPDGAVVAIGTATAAALESHGYSVDRVPEEYSSAGLVEALGSTPPVSTVDPWSERATSTRRPSTSSPNASTRPAEEYSFGTRSTE